MSRRGWSIPTVGLAGLGMGLAYSPLALIVLREAAGAEQGRASSALSLTDSLGTALGTGITGAAVAASVRDSGGRRCAASRSGSRVAIAVAALGLVLSSRLSRGRAGTEPLRGPCRPPAPERPAPPFACGRLSAGPGVAPVARTRRHHPAPSTDPLGGPEPMSAESLREKIREIPDFPKPGILFYDITTLLKDPAAYKEAIDLMLEPYQDERIDIVVGMESRGFIFSAPMAYLLDAGLVPVRKLGKLPAETITVEYALEYGSNTLEIHRDAIQPGQKVLIVDDLLATGGTVKGTIELIERLKGEVVGLAFLVELEFLKGRDRLEGRRVTSVVQY